MPHFISKKRYQHLFIYLICKKYNISNQPSKSKNKYRAKLCGAVEIKWRIFNIQLLYKHHLQEKKKKKLARG